MGTLVYSFHSLSNIYTKDPFEVMVSCFKNVIYSSKIYFKTCLKILSIGEVNKV